jgi:hypothetical protein
MTSVWAETDVAISAFGKSRQRHPDKAAIIRNKANAESFKTRPFLIVNALTFIFHTYGFGSAVVNANLPNEYKSFTKVFLARYDFAGVLWKLL